jgi:predicted O-linked N-acetylglucosamine transferase (SPINDLY family)
MMGISECIAADTGDYVDIAVGLGTDVDRRLEVEARISEASHVLFEDIASVREHERMLLDLVERARSTGARTGASGIEAPAVSGEGVPT